MKLHRSLRIAVVSTSVAALGLTGMPVASAQLDTTPPVATINTGPGLLAAITILLNEPAGPIKVDNVLVELGDGTPVEFRRRCFDAGGSVVGCGGLVRRALLTPRQALPLGDRMTVIVNPPGTADPVRDASSNAAATTTKVQPMIASQSEVGSAIVHAWTPVTASQAMGRRFLRADGAGMRALFTFHGDRVTWFTRRGPKDGRAEVRVDGQLVRRVDLSAAKTTLKVRRSYAGFGSGKHTLAILVMGAKGARGDGTSVTVDGYQDERGTFNEEAATYRWGHPRWPGARNRVAMADSKGATLTVSFAGGGIDWWQPIGPRQGIAQVIVDGKVVRRTDQYATSAAVRRQSVTGLESGIHTLVLKAIGKKRAASGGTRVGLDHVDTSAPVGMFKGHGAWIDLWDYNNDTTAATIGRMLDEMRRYGVVTLYLQTARYNSGRNFLYGSRIPIWLRLAKQRGMKVVGWYFPAYGKHLDVDVRRSIAVANYRSSQGHRFDALGVDIEFRGETSGPAEFNKGIVEHLQRVRAALGVTYPISSIAPPPNQMELAPSSWAGFPWKAIGRLSDAIQPMAYSSYRKGNQCPQQPRYCTRLYTRNAVTSIRAETGQPNIPIHVIGGIADLLTRAEMRDFVDGAHAAKAFGASMYDHLTMMKDPRKYEFLQDFKASNP